MSHAEPSVLIVDDERVNIDILVDLLKPRYRTLVATSGEQALRRAGGQPAPDIVLLDVMMPGMDGYEVCRRLKADAGHPRHPGDLRDRPERGGRRDPGFALGAADYITKPFSPPIVEARVKAHLENKHARDFIEDRNRVLQGMVLERTRELAATQDATILSMATLAETRDKETGLHLRRTQGYVRSLALELREHPRFRDAARRPRRRAALQVRAPPRHRQGRGARPDPAQTRPSRPRGVRGDEAAHALRLRRHRGDGERSWPRPGPRPRPPPSCASLARSPAAITRNGTARATPTGCAATRSRSPRASWPWPTCTTR